MVKSTEPARDVERFASHPPRVRRREEDHARGDVLRLPNPAEGDICDERLEVIDESRALSAVLAMFACTAIALLPEQVFQRERSGSSLTQTHQTQPKRAPPRNKNIPKFNIWLR